MLTLAWKENRSTRRKILEAHERSTTGELEMPHQTWFQWREAQRALTACASRASLKIT